MKRHGTTLIESLAACFLAGVATMLALQFFQAAETQRRSANQRLAANAEAANIIDRATMLPWEDLPDGKFGDGGKKSAGMELSEEAKKILPQASATVDVTKAEGSPDAKRICVHVRWQADSGVSTSEVHLVAWKYRGSR